MERIAMNKKISKNRQLSFSLYICIVPILFFAGLIASEMQNSLQGLMLSFCASYVITVLFSINYYGLISLYSIYLYTSTFFLYDCFFLTLSGDFNFLVMAFPKTYSFSEDIGFKFIIVCFVHLYVTHIAYSCIKKSHLIFNNTKIDSSYHNDFVLLGKIVFLLFLFPTLYKIYLTVAYVSSHGYQSFFADDRSAYIPSWLNGVFTCFIVGYLIFMAGNPKKKDEILYSVVFFIVFMLSSLRGQRGPALGMLVFFVYWLSKKHSITFNLRKLVFIMCFIVFFTILIGNMRAAYGKNSSTNKASIPVSLLIQRALWSQTTTRAVPLLVIRGNLEYHPYPFIFSPFFNQFNKILYPEKKRTELSAQKFNRIGSVTMYNISKKSFMRGTGYGGAFIAEAFDCGGYIGLIFWSVVLAAICLTIDSRKLDYSHFIMPVIILFLQTFALLPRNMLFDVFYNLHYLVLIYFFLFCLGILKWSLNSRQKEICDVDSSVYMDTGMVRTHSGRDKVCK